MDDAPALAPYGAWAEGVDRDTAAKALIAIGIVAGHDPKHVSGMGGGQLAELLAQAVADHETLNTGRPWNSQIPCPWTDPLALAGWTPDAVPPASEWAAAWQAFGPHYVRLALTVSERVDLVWLTDTLRSVHGIFNTFVGLESGPTSTWRFPLRAGFLPNPRGRESMENLKEGFAGSSWRSTLIDPFLLDRTRVSCDILIVEEDAWEAPTALNTLREIRANMVVVAHPTGGLQGPTMQVVDKIVDLTDAWAVGFLETSDVPTWIVRFVEEVSHAQPLDQAFDRVADGPRVFVADPRVVTAETADQRAARLAHSLRTLTSAGLTGADVGLSAPERDLAEILTHIAEEGAFLSEAGDSSELSRLEDATGDLIDRANATRRIKARISAAGRPDAPLSAFRPGTDHTIDVRIGSPGLDEWLTAAEPFPEEALSPDQPHTLTVVLTEPDLLPVPQRQTIVLPSVGDSTPATFTLTTRADTAHVDARVIVLLGNRVLQTVRLPAEVTADDSAATRSTDVARPELAIAPATDGMADRRTFSAAFLVNRNLDGAARATAMTQDRAAMVKLNSDDVTTAVRKISQQLTAIVDKPQNYGSLDAHASVQLLVALAFHGAKLRSALVTDTPGLEQVMARRGAAIQVVAAKPDAYFPFEFAYDFPIPDPTATLCPDALATLSDPDPDATCPGTHSHAVVCPLGFWAMQHVIERHAYQPTDELPADFALRSTPRRRDQVVRLGPTLFAASHRVDKVVPGSRDIVLAALATAGQHVPVDAWQEWKQAVKDQPHPALLLLLAHTVHNNVVDAYGLEIGKNDVALDFADCLPGGPAVALLLGCETATAGAVSYERFPAEFRRAGAKVVIATLTEILGRHAAPVAARLVEEIHRQCRVEPRGIGEVMFTLRRRLLAEGMLPVLTLTAFGDADWLVGP